MAQIGSASPQESQSSNASSPPVSVERALLNKYCVTCHNEKLRTAGLTLEKADISSVGTDSALWEKVLDKVRIGAMPPTGLPRPDAATYASLTAYLDTALDRVAESKPQPGRVSVHRLNRAEYTNAIRDLLGLEVDVDALLPVDDSGYGFDNIAAVLSVSPMLLERYISAARKVSRLAIGDPDIRADIQTWDVPPLLMQDQRMSEDLPFGSRGGVALRHNFPLDGEYVVKVRLQGGGKYHDEDILGISEPHQLEIRLDNVRLKLFTIGGVYPLPVPGTSTAGDEAKYYRTADTALEIRFQAKAGARLVGVDFVDEAAEPEGNLQSGMAAFRYLNKRAEQVLLYVASVTFEGPYNAKGAVDSPSRQRIFTCHPTRGADELPCAKKILSTLARRAYRRPVTDADVQALLGLYKKGRDKGDFEAGIMRALQGMLVYPEFLFRIERDPPNLAAGSPYKVSDLEMASRQSFFLWSSIPDEALLDLATRGQLKDPAVLEQQVRRMLADSRSKALVRNFAGQWLYLRNMRTVGPDAVTFPEFDDNLRDGFARETTSVASGQSNGLIESGVMRSKLCVLIAGAGLLLTAMPAAAHHSFAAEFDRNKPIKLTGTISKFDLTNPHSWIYIDVKDADGKVATWGFETASLISLYRKGFKKDSLKVGEIVTIEGFLAKDGTRTGNGQRLTLPNGTQVILGTEENPG